MKKMYEKVVVAMLILTMAFATTSLVKAEETGTKEQANPLDIIKVEGATVKLEGQEVTTIVPADNSTVGKKEFPSYEVSLPKWGYGSFSHIAIPVKVTERGFLNMNAEAIDVTDMVYFSISKNKEPMTVDKGEPDSLFSIGNFMKKDSYNLTRGCDLLEPGIYYVKFYVSGNDKPQSFTFDLAFTKADNRTLKNKKEIRTAGLGDSSVYYKVIADKDSIIQLNYNQGVFDKFYKKPSGGSFTLCNSKKKSLGKTATQKIKASGTLNWYVKKGTYYIRSNVEDQNYGLKYTRYDLLQSPTINKLKLMSKTISGTAAKNSTVYLKINDDSKVYTAKTSSKGVYKINLKGETVGSGKTYKVYSGDGKNKMSKTVTAKL